MVEGVTEEDESVLHCLCRLTAGTARFRTLMNCDVCKGWFHPPCVRQKVRVRVRVREPASRDRNDFVFVCPMCAHARGQPSEMGGPPVQGFYGRRMKRPGLAELHPLMEKAQKLPVGGVDGQAYLSYILTQVGAWRNRCRDQLVLLEEYIEGGATMARALEEQRR
ncbi:unnamed protein product [Choristocarpus tenellus]